ncbi:hypothetical protein WJX72_008270 [[Myrmecia] bisecta]|uniref:Cyclin-like domain-containing protein n=1 Tax=[Myrmecia] bisecta TaxID=41462 RepID=A0AAW1PM61_9CHLO
MGSGCGQLGRHSSFCILARYVVCRFWMWIPRQTVSPLHVPLLISGLSLVTLASPRGSLPNFADQAVLATGQALLHRFYCKESLTNFNVKAVAMACVFLSTKLEENARRPKDVLSVFYRMERRRECKPLDVLDVSGRRYEEMKGEMIRIERHMLRAFGFILHVEHPHKYVLNYAQLLLDANTELLQEAWNLTNDSLRTTLCIRFKGETVACGVIYMAARRLKIALPENPPWWEVYSVSKADMNEVCRSIVALYEMPKAAHTMLAKPAPSGRAQSLPAYAERSPGSAEASSALAARSPAPPALAITTPQELRNSNGAESKHEANGKEDHREDSGSSHLLESTRSRNAGEAERAPPEDRSTDQPAPGSLRSADSRHRKEREHISRRHDRDREADSRKRKAHERGNSRDKRDSSSQSHRPRSKGADGHRKDADRSSRHGQAASDRAREPARDPQHVHKRQKEAAAGPADAHAREESKPDMQSRSSALGL